MAIRWLGLGAVAITTVATNALLITPNMQVENTQPDISGWSVIDPENHLLVVPCQGCSADGLSADSSMLLNLTVGNVPGTVELNGEVIYPVNPFNMARNPKVQLVPSDVSLVDIKNDISKYQENEDVISGWLFGASSRKTSDFGDEIISIQLDIQSIGSKHVHVPHIEFGILKDSHDRMLIVSSDYTHPESGVPDEAGCTGQFCSLRETITDRIHNVATAITKALKPSCRKGKDTMASMPHMDMDAGEPGDIFKLLPGIGNIRPSHSGPKLPSHHKHHHHHHHHAGIHAFFTGFWQVLRDFGLPILIGLVAGVLTYALGMAIGCTVLLLWLKFRRSRNGGADYDSVALDEDDAARKELDIEAAARDSFDSAPPVYEHAPIYDEKE